MLEHWEFTSEMRTAFLSTKRIQKREREREISHYYLHFKISVYKKLEVEQNVFLWNYQARIHLSLRVEINVFAQTWLYNRPNISEFASKFYSRFPRVHPQARWYVWEGGWRVFPPPSPCYHLGVIFVPTRLV